MNLLQLGLLAGSLAIAGAAFGQGITTSAMSGTVTDKQGKPVGSGTVSVVHEPSGTRATTAVRPNGQFNLSGLRVGGPYTVTVTSPSATTPETRKDVYLDLGQTLELTVGLGADIVQMQAFKVEGERDTTFGAEKMGGGSGFTDAEILNVASVRSDIQDIARLDSRLTLNSLNQGGELSAQGQNFRFNSLLIDGVEANDPFGINSNGMSSLRSPIPLESLQALTIELNPYDIRRSGFTGALMNAVTKSGSNRFEGSIQYEYTGRNLRAKNARTGLKEEFDETRYTYTFSGPILKDRLFFSLSYDDYQRESTPPTAGFIFSAASLVLVDQAIAKAKSLGYDTGSFGAGGNIAKQKTYLGKIDWNISDAHRLSITYRNNESVFPNFTGVTSTSGSSLSNMWFDQPRNAKNYNVQLFNQWTPDFRTEASFSNTKYEASPLNRGAPFPAIGIGGLSGTRTDTGATTTGFLNFGTENSRQLNILNTKEKLFKLSGEYSLGNHTLVAGGELNETIYDDRFLQSYFGNYTFNTSAPFGTTPARTGIENWLLGLPTSYTDAQPLPGYTIDNVFASWTYKGYSGYVQDTWRPNSRLTVVGGLRLDYPSVGKKPAFNQKFFDAFGLRNDVTNDGDYTIAPRAGFNYRLPGERKTELRGGVGLFQGRNPAVWLANAYQNAGTASLITGNVNGNNQPTVQFQPDVTKQPIPSGTPPTASVNLTSEGFQQPSSWKGNIALDRQLSFQNLVFTAEITATKVAKGVFLEYLNYQTPTTGAATMPDGRIRYAGNVTPNYNPNAAPNNTTTFPQVNTAGRRRISTFADVYRITNTSEGGSRDFTVALNRPMKNRWSGGVAWTIGKSTEVSGLTNSTAGSNYINRAVFNPNEDMASRSNTETRNKIVARLTREFQFIEKFKTTLSLIYEGHTGRPYSWIFKGDANG
ncbi:MAG: TonB-dependent receptor, partial [Opitutaceae bacterium]